MPHPTLFSRFVNGKKNQDGLTYFLHMPRAVGSVVNVMKDGLGMLGATGGVAVSDKKCYTKQEGCKVSRQTCSIDAGAEKADKKACMDASRGL